MPKAQKAEKISSQSKKIKKLPSKFEQLVANKTKKAARVVEARKPLIKEYQATKKSNVIEDKRFLKKREPNYKFAENLDKKRKKVSMFNLDSDDEDTNNFKLTHQGVAIEELNDFKETDIPKDLSEDEGLDADYVGDFHFGGFDEEENKNENNFLQRKKTKQEIYKELISKSKKEKYLRQKQQEENEEKVDQIDENFDDILQMLGKKPNQYKDKKNMLQKNDNYLRLQNELMEEKRLKPEAENTVDPNRPDKKKKERRRSRMEPEKEEDENNESDERSNIGDDEEARAGGKKNRKVQELLKKQRHSKKFLSFIDEIRALKEAHDKENGIEDEEGEDELDEVDLEDDDEDEEGNGEDGDEEDGFEEEDELLDEFGDEF